MVKAICATVILVLLLLLAIPYIIAGTICMAVLWAVDKVNEIIWR